MRPFLKTVLTLAVLLSLSAPNAAGAELWITTRAGATVSDNIHRYPSGLEENGSILMEGIGFMASGEEGRRSFTLSLEGGWETLESESDSTSEEIYLMNLEFSLPVSTTARFEGTAGASRETASPEPEDPRQNRSLVKTSRAGFSFVNELSAVTRWEAGLDRDWEEEENEDDIQRTTSRILWSRNLSRVRTFTLEGTGRNGSDDIDGTSWKGSSVALELTARHSQSLTRTLGLSWEDLTFEETDGTEGSSWKAGISAGYESGRSPGWLHTGSLGVVLLSHSSEEETWEPEGSFLVEKDISRTALAHAHVEFRAFMRDPRESDVESTRQGRITAGLAWNASRSITVFPRMGYHYEEISGIEAEEDREDKTLIARIGVMWVPVPTWLMEFDLVTENRESTDPANELEESRVELQASCRFR